VLLAATVEGGAGLDGRVTADAGSLWIRRTDRFLRHIDATTQPRERDPHPPL